MPLITCRNLSKIGRVGNQLFLYCFAKGYALAHHCDLEVGPWFGQNIFVNATEPPPSKQLWQTQLDSEHPHKLNGYFGKTDLDLFVYAQHQCYLDYYTRSQVKEWLKLKPEHECHSSVACIAHLRRGDYVTKYSKHYCIVTEKSYLDAVEKFNLPKPTYLSDDRPSDQWLVDFQKMRDAEILLRSNSSFSWWAATLGSGKVYAPVVEDKTGWQDVEFVEGNWPCTAGKHKNQSDLRLKE